MTSAFLFQQAVSAAAIAVLIGISAWAKMPRPAPPLDESRVRQLLADDFPEAECSAIWIDADRSAAVARSGAKALLLFRLGDSFVSRDLPVSALSKAQLDKGRAVLALEDASASTVSFALSTGQVWPPLSAV
jgi:hypothetical protein